MVKQREVLTTNQVNKVINNAKTFKLQLIIETCSTSLAEKKQYLFFTTIFLK